MMKPNRRLFLCAFFSFLLLAAARLRAAEVIVFAAASLTDALQEIARHYETKTSDRIVFNFGASSALARQIAAGAPADIFFSADEARMDALQQQHLIVPATRRNRLGNALVVVVPLDSSLRVTSASDLAKPDVERIALADPQAVPAGIYARAWLEKKGVWAMVQPKVVPTENVRAALAAVASGNVAAGVVYKTDAAISQKVKVACVVPAADAPDIRYPMALVTGAQNAEAARRFLDYLAAAEAGAIFEKFGFSLRD